MHLGAPVCNLYVCTCVYLCDIVTDVLSFLRMFRVNGVVRNMPEFAEAFSCPSDSKLNPSKKCTLW